MKIFFRLLVIVSLGACSHQVLNSSSSSRPESNPVAATECKGSVDLPEELLGKFVPVEAPELLGAALGAPGKGGLCQGRVYQSREGVDVLLWRAWNSTNPGSRLGQWWAWQLPQGEVSLYRADYEICYQWSPLDRLVRCKLKPGVKLVVGTGQSAVCSNYLFYEVSPAQQIYLSDASDALSECTDWTGEFQWTPKP